MSVQHKAGDTVRIAHQRDNDFRTFVADGIMQRNNSDGVTIVFYVEDSIVLNEIGTVTAVNENISTIVMNEVEHTEIRTDVAAVRMNVAAAMSLFKSLENYLQSMGKVSNEDAE